MRYRRWAKFILEKDLKLNCIEPSEAIHIKKFKNFQKVNFINKTIKNCNLKSNSHNWILFGVYTYK